ncbi:MAG TPA: MBOAT family O-acyltransferase [Bacteroidales bacterium]|jgi:D-alanyl-lipoteichoic acid acyltransferase DltB (MBOAT superfamily)|nr:MBOAT family O-acyltransferase [Bacteroidales bacterium]
MLFNSLEFIVFFPIVVALYYILPHKNRWALLLIASCYFYMVFVPVYIVILGFTIVIDYFAGILLENTHGRKRKIWLIASIIANTGVLAVFKYYNFLNENLTVLLKGFTIENPIPYLSILLPIGLSFHTFQAMSYTIEVYRGNQKAERNFGIYALYVMFFPQLVAGPIERPQNMLHQFHEEKFIDVQRISDGLKHIIWGMFKKVVIADRLAEYVNVVYSNPGEFYGQHLIIATIFFSFQIYCDFSGYSEIAIGTAKILGINLMMNFRRPYLATNIREFWQRWHISLSTWFRDYLYFPLGGSRVGKHRHYINLLIVFLVSGLWHGANWTFVIWGALHGIYQVFGQITAPYRNKINDRTGISKYPVLQKGIQISLTFILAAFAWIFFRAQSLDDAMIIVRNLFVFEPGISLNLYRIPGEFGIAVFLIVFLLIAELIKEKFEFDVKLLPFPRPYNWIAIGLAVLGIFVLGVWGGHDFIYFQF